MRILITGATGFVGRQLVAILANHQLTLVTRSVSKAKQMLGNTHHYVKDLTALENLNNIDAVINLAGEPIVGKRWSTPQKQLICESRWNTTAQLAQLIQQSQTPPTSFISASAVGYYGRQGEQMLDEEAEYHQEFTHEICQEWERLALQAQSSQTRVCIIRIGIVLGLKGGALAKMLPPFKLGLGGPIGHGRQGMSWIHQDDLIDLIQFLLTTPSCQGVFNATAPHPVSNAQFAKSLGQALNRPTVLTTPPFMLKLAMGEMSELLTEGQYVLPKRALAAGFRFSYPFLSQAFAQLFSTR